MGSSLKDLNPASVFRGRQDYSSRILTCCPHSLAICNAESLESRVTDAQLPSEQAHLSGRTGELRIGESLHAAPVRCSAWFGSFVCRRRLGDRRTTSRLGMRPSEPRLGDREPPRPPALLLPNVHRDDPSPAGDTRSR